MSRLDKIPEAVRDLKTDGEAAFMQALLEIEPDEDIMSCEYCEYYRVKADRFGRKCRIFSFEINHRHPQLLPPHHLLRD